MNKSFAVLSIVSAFTFAVSPQSSWINYQSPLGRFSVSIPTEPKITTQERTDKRGQNIKQHMATAFDGTLGLIVGYYDFDSDTTFSVKHACEGIARSLNGTL